MSDESQEEPKLIIDEDWKAQVEREREELKKKASQETSAGPAGAGSTGPDSAGTDPTGSGATSASSESSGPAGSESQQLPPPPPASFSFLLTSLATQAMAALGQMRGEDEQPMPVNLDYARHFIDLMGMLEEKTAGNLDEEEKAFLQQTLHEMRMMFVAVSRQAQNRN